MEPIIRRIDFKDGAIGTLTIFEIGDGDELKSWKLQLENTNETGDRDKYVIRKDELGRYSVYTKEMTYLVDSIEFGNWHRGTASLSTIDNLKLCSSDFCTQLADAINDEIEKM